MLLLRPTLAADQWLGAVVGLSSGAIASVAYVSVRELGRLGSRGPHRILVCSGHHAVRPGVVAAFRPPPCRLCTRSSSCCWASGSSVASPTGNDPFIPLRPHPGVCQPRCATVVFASLFGAVLWNEIMPWSSWLAIALIVSSAIMISLRTRRSA